MEEPRLIEMDLVNGRVSLGRISRGGTGCVGRGFHARPHGGESVAMLRERVLSALDDISKLALLMPCYVTHSGVIRAAMAGGAQSTDFDLTVAFGGSVVWNPH